MEPGTVAEWAEYISTLRGSELYSKAIAANSLEFIQTLKQEGFSGGEISNILLLFARQFEADEQLPPDDLPGVYLSYQDLLDYDNARQP